LGKVKLNRNLHEKPSKIAQSIPPKNPLYVLFGLIVVNFGPPSSFQKK